MHDIILGENENEEGSHPVQILSKDKFDLFISFIIELQGLLFEDGKEEVVSCSKEIKEMFDDIAYFRSLDVYGVVLGVLNDNNTVDINLTNKFVNTAGKLEVTFHKAIDSCDNVLEELRMIINNTGVSSILTSGGFSDAFAGHKIIKEMIKIAGKNISIIVAGSITSENILSLHELIEGKQYHGKKIVD